ncbi:hypothetical protein HK105_204388 [Polyrhizophydium stewartii]|uniref:SWIRM domain-containing protein n=1 Tax=Polyrhizophydium stewartii TaxID=2732419 RepID=A0ABR4N940_9FUNG
MLARGAPRSRSASPPAALAAFPGPLAFARAAAHAAAQAAAAGHGASGSFGGVIRSAALPAAAARQRASSPLAAHPPKRLRASGVSGSPSSSPLAALVADEEIARDLLAPGRVGAIDMAKYRNTAGAPPVFWKKGGLLYIPPDTPGYAALTPEELTICSTLRIMPDQYLHIKEVIMTQVERRGPFKKRDAKSWFRIDVNKTAILFDWFRALGWIPDDNEWERRFRSGRTGTAASASASPVPASVASVSAALASAALASSPLQMRHHALDAQQQHPLSASFKSASPSPMREPGHAKSASPTLTREHAHAAPAPRPLAALRAPLAMGQSLSQPAIPTYATLQDSTDVVMLSREP